MQTRYLCSLNYLLNCMKESKRLIITDDDEDDRYFLESLFREANEDIEVTTVVDSYQLFQLLDSEPNLPSLLILDLNLPLIDGFEILKKIKSDEERKVLPVIIVTTSEVEAEINLAYRLGANAFITKPDLYSDFRQTIFKLTQFWFETAKLP